MPNLFLKNVKRKKKAVKPRIFLMRHRLYMDML